MPAGDMDCLYQAVYNGCDAVYVSGYNFGARKYAHNFSNEELISAIKFCHLYGVKIYVTMNTLIKNGEVDEFINQARFLHKNGVDALIVQDFGMICLLRQMFPNLEIHASTQMNNSSKDTCDLMKKVGVKRVVLSRELSLDEIEEIDAGIEKEVFIHGALCVSYSGGCLMSSMLGGRSGNRGECAGCCRMPFTLVKNGKVISDNKYLLSMKELNTTSRIQELIDSSIDSFKIEGRMKSPLYVGFITNLYRRLIDGESVDMDYENSRLKTIFNRKFTTGHLFNADKHSLINCDRPNHIGLKIGKVKYCDQRIKINLDRGVVLHQFDAIRFVKSNKGMVVNYLYDSNMKLCSSAQGVCYVDNKVGLNILDEVSKTDDYLLNSEYQNLNNKRKVAVTFNIVGHIGDRLKISLSDGYSCISSYGNVVSQAISSPIDKESISNHLSKLGNSPFVIKDISYDIDEGIFIQVGEINRLRRELISKLVSIRENRKVEFVEESVNFESSGVTGHKPNIICSVYNEEQLKTCLLHDIDLIYVNDISLYEKYKDNKSVYYVLPRCFLDYSKYDMNKVVSSDIFDYRGKNIRGSYPMNVTNIYTGYFLMNYGVKNIPISVELSQDEVYEFIKLYNSKFGYGDFEVFSYGYVENMIIKGNVFDIGNDFCSYEIIDSKNRKFPVYFDGVNTHIFNHEKRLYNIDSNLCSKRIDFYGEEEKAIINVLKNMRDKKSV